MQAYSVDLEDEAEIRSQLAQLIADQALDDVTHLYNPRVPRLGIHYAPLFIVHQKNGKKRLITDYTETNKSLADTHFRMDTAKTIRQLVATRKFNSGAGLDITNAFPHFATRPEDQDMLLILGPDNRVYRPKCAFFGLKPIPFLWTKVTKVPLRIIRENGIVASMYIDDGLNLAESTLQAFLDLIFMLLTFQYLGYTLSWKKITLPTPRPIHLGLVWDMVDWIVLLTPERLKRLRIILSKVLRSRRIPMRLAAQLLGTLQSTRDALMYVQLESRELQREYNTVLQRNPSSIWTRSFLMTPEVRRSLHQLLGSLHHWNGKSFLPPLVDAVVKTDASESGGGGNLTSTVSQGQTLIRTALHWTPKLLHGYLARRYSWTTIQSWFADPAIPLTAFIHIQVLEAISIHQSLKVFARENPLWHKTILVLTDNMASAWYLAKEGGTRSRDLSLVAEEMLRWARKKKIRLYVEHIPGVLNVLAVSLLQVGPACHASALIPLTPRSYPTL